MKSSLKSTLAAVVCMGFVLSQNDYDPAKTKDDWNESVDIQTDLVRIVSMLLSITAALKCISFIIELSGEKDRKLFPQIMDCVKLSALLVSLIYSCFYVCQLSKIVLLLTSAICLCRSSPGSCYTTRYNPVENETLPFVSRLLIGRFSHFDSDRTSNPVFFHEHFKNELFIYVAVIWIATTGFLLFGKTQVEKLTKLIVSVSAIVTLPFVCYLLFNGELMNDWQHTKLLQLSSDQYLRWGAFILVIDMYNALAIYFFASSKKWTFLEISLSVLFAFGLLLAKSFMCSLMAQTTTVDETMLLSLHGFIPRYLIILLEKVNVVKNSIMLCVILVTFLGSIIFIAHLALCEIIIDSLNLYLATKLSIKLSTTSLLFCISGTFASFLALWPTKTVQVALQFVVYNISTAFGPILGWAAIIIAGYDVGRRLIVTLWKLVGGSPKIVPYLFHAWRHLAFGIFLLSITGDMGRFLSSLIMFRTMLSKTESDLNMMARFVSMVPFMIVVVTLAIRFLRTKCN